MNGALFFFFGVGSGGDGWVVCGAAVCVAGSWATVAAAPAPPGPRGGGGFGGSEIGGAPAPTGTGGTETGGAGGFETGPVEGGAVPGATGGLEIGGARRTLCWAVPAAASCVICPASGRAELSDDRTARAAPDATAVFGSPRRMTGTSGKASLTIRSTIGDRLDPPTREMPDRSAAVRPASSTQRSSSTTVSEMYGRTRSSNSS